MKYFRVKTGHGKTEFVRVDETELPTALRAQVTGKVGMFKEGSVSGNHIISITPDWNKELNLNPAYDMTGEDMAQIPSARRDEYTALLGIVNEQVTGQLGGRRATDEPVKKLGGGTIGEILERRN